MYKRQSRDNPDILDRIQVFQDEIKVKNNVTTILKMNENINKNLNEHMTDVLQRKSRLNPYQLRHTIQLYKDRTTLSEDTMALIDELTQSFRQSLEDLLEVNDILQTDDHRDHLEKLIALYQRETKPRADHTSLGEEIEGPVSANLIDPYAAPTPKLISRFSFSMPDLEKDFSDVVDELDVIHAVESLNSLGRKESIDRLESFLEFKKADIKTIPDKDLHLELKTKVNIS